jgi:cyclic pyranopterin phosphate synthase
MRVSDVSERGRLPQFRVTVNSRCGRACFFCRPSGEAVATAAGAELAVDDLVDVAAVVREAGIPSIKLTGGDPALYKPLEEAVERLRDQAGFTDIEVISRHPRIGERAAPLAELGVTQFNMSLDTLDPTLHHELTGIDDHAAVVEALYACVATGIPVKVNMVVMAGVNDDQVVDLVDFCGDLGVHTLKLLDVIKDLDEGAESFARRLALKRGRQLEDLYTPLEYAVDSFIRHEVSRETRAQGGLGHPMTAITLDSGLEVLLKDSTEGSWYGSICRNCVFFPCHDALMALRLTADLRLQFCLLRGDNTIDLTEIVNDQPALKATIREALLPYAGASFYTATTETLPLAMEA